MPGLEAYQVGGQGQVTLQPFYIASPRDPTAQDLVHPDGFPYTQGWGWLNTTSGALFVFVGTTGAPWQIQVTVTGQVLTLTGGVGGAISPDLAGNITLAGTPDQIATTGAGNTITFSLVGPYSPATFTDHGVLVGSAAAAITALAVGTDGQVLTGNTAADPAFADIGTNSGLTAFGVVLAEGAAAFKATAAGLDGQVLLAATGADPAFGALTTSTGIVYTTGANALAVDVASGGYKVNAASAGVPLVKQNAYTVTQAGAASFSLPAAAAVGDVFLIASASTNAAGWVITQGAGQVIYAGASTTTPGGAGTLSGAVQTSVEIMCTVANLEFVVVGGSGLVGLTFA